MLIAQVTIEGSSSSGLLHCVMHWPKLSGVRGRGSCDTVDVIRSERGVQYGTRQDKTACGEAEAALRESGDAADANAWEWYLASTFTFI